MVATDPSVEAGEGGFEGDLPLWLVLPGALTRISAPNTPKDDRPHPAEVVGLEGNEASSASATRKTHTSPLPSSIHFLLPCSGLPCRRLPFGHSGLASVSFLGNLLGVGVIKVGAGATVVAGSAAFFADWCFCSDVGPACPALTLAAAEGVEEARCSPAAAAAPASVGLRTKCCSDPGLPNRGNGSLLLRMVNEARHATPSLCFEGLGSGMMHWRLGCGAVLSLDLNALRIFTCTVHLLEKCTQFIIHSVSTAWPTLGVRFGRNRGNTCCR